MEGFYPKDTLITVEDQDGTVENMRIMFDTYLKVGNYYLGKKIKNIGVNEAPESPKMKEPKKYKASEISEKPTIRDPYLLYVKNVPFAEFTDEEIKEGYNTFHPYRYDTCDNVFEQEYKKRFG